MSENRNRYSSAPLQNLRQAERKAKAAPRKAPGAPAAPRMRSFTGLQMMLIVILPVLFIVSLLVQNNLLFLIFSVLSVLSLMAAWLLSAFVPNARATLTIIHIALVLVALFAVLISPPQAPVEDKQSANDLQSIFSRESSASMVDMMQKQQQLAGPSPSPNPGHASFAQQRLEQFMSAWSNIDYGAMASYCIPTWVEAQSDPKTSMFHLRANRSVVSYEVLDVSGNDTDQTRTINMNVVIDKSNGSAPQTHRFQVLMKRINDDWFVDPNSLGSLGVIESPEEVAKKVITTIVPTPTPDPNLTLYYNPNGGLRYHKDSNCRSINAEYLPLTHSFQYAELFSNPQYKRLVPCGVCGAPGH